MEGRASKRSIIVAALVALLCALAVSMAMGPSTLLLAAESTEESTEEESSQTTYDSYYLIIDGESWYMVVSSTGSVSLQIVEDDGSAGLTMGYDVTDNGDGTYTLTAMKDNVSGFPAEFTIYADEDGNLYLVDYETTEGESTASEEDSIESADEETSEETLAQTGDGTSAMVAGVASMGAIALAAGVLSGKRRKA